MPGGFGLEPGFIHFDYNNNKLKSLEVVSLTACTNNSLEIHLRVPSGTNQLA
jgi:hypothetical protein